MPYIVPTTIAFPPTGDAVGTTHRPADRTGLAYPNYVAPPASLPQTSQCTGQLWPKGDSAGGGGGHTIQDEGIDLTARTALNFTGPGVAAIDDTDNSRTVVYIPGGGVNYIHIQSTLATVWTVNHNLGKHPAVQAEDSGGSLIIGSVMHLDDNTLTITFSVAITGRANCS